MAVSWVKASHLHRPCGYRSPDKKRLSLSVFRARLRWSSSWKLLVRVDAANPLSLYTIRIRRPTSSATIDLKHPEYMPTHRPSLASHAEDDLSKRTISDHREYPSRGWRARTPFERYHCRGHQQGQDVSLRTEETAFPLRGV